MPHLPCSLIFSLEGAADILVAEVYNGQQSYIIFGTKEPWPAAINGGGWSVSGAGDLNGDGIADILIAEVYTVVQESYVIFGSEGAWPATISVSSLNGRNGFAINNLMATGDGLSVSGAGDINGDSIADILIGARGVNHDTGQSYLIFGSRSAWPAAINASSLNGRNGFAIAGINAGDWSGYSVSGAGDVNGDGIADLLIGTPGVNDFAGQSYVIFGQNQTDFNL